MQPWKGRHFWTFHVWRVGWGGARPYVVLLHPQQWKASCMSPVHACGFGDGCCTRHVFEEVRHFLTFFVFWKTKLHDQFCAFHCGLGANLDYIVATQNGFEHGPLRNMCGKSMGFKASGVMLSGMLCKSGGLDRSPSRLIHAPSGCSPNLLFVEMVRSMLSWSKNENGPIKTRKKKMQTQIFLIERATKQNVPYKFQSVFSLFTPAEKIHRKSREDHNENHEMDHMPWSARIKKCQKMPLFLDLKRCPCVKVNAFRHMEK